ncbi:MAG: Nudix family hydrolase [Gammaproteobacteria bacterium]|nr:Nudix family hydrolase [Gammaproteobacteria bacterium]
MLNTEADSIFIHVAVAAIVNSKNEVLVALRPDHVHQGGLWEFPGGKVEPGETVLQALGREIKEELDIRIDNKSPLIQIRHHYVDKSVLLDVWLVHSYSGQARGMEGQPVSWLSIAELDASKFPEANMAIISALKLPDHYMISGKFDNYDDFKNKLVAALNKGNKIVQLRCKQISDAEEYLKVAKIAEKICKQYDTILLLNTTVDVFNGSDADGLHLNSQALFEFNKRPVGDNKLLSVSCHNIEEIQHAEKLGADILLLSPVRETSSHPGVPGIGWEKFSQLVAQVNMPVYALGGMKAADLADAKESGAQGVAAISSFWLDEK